MGTACSIHWRNDKYVGSFSREVAKERDNGWRQHPAILLFKQKAPTSRSILQASLKLNYKKRARKELHAIYPGFPSNPQPEYRSLQ